MSKSPSKYLARWQGRSATRTLELSDGFPVEIRPVQLINLMLNGTIPQLLLREAMSLEPGEDGEYDLDDMAQVLPLINAVVLAAVVDPPLSADGAEGTIPIDDVPFIDRVTIFQEVSNPAAELQPFRQQPDGDEAAVSDG